VDTKSVPPIAQRHEGFVMSTQELKRPDKDTVVGPERTLKELALSLASGCAAPFRKIERAIHVALPQFSAEESIVLHNLAQGSSIKEISRQLRLSRMNLYRLMGDLRKKTGTADDVALSVWVLRNMNGLGESRSSVR
jgi:DNA-binding CsgD family transcriptional regulator